MEPVLTDLSVHHGEMWIVLKGTGGNETSVPCCCDVQDPLMVFFARLPLLCVGSGVKLLKPDWDNFGLQMLHLLL